jgi:hypothetical protein
MTMTTEFAIQLDFSGKHEPKITNRRGHFRPPTITNDWLCTFCAPVICRKTGGKGGQAEIFQSSKNRTLQVLSKPIRIGAASSGKVCASPELGNSHGWLCWWLTIRNA